MRKIFRVEFSNTIVDVEALNVQDANQQARHFLINKRNYMPSIEATKIELIAEPITEETNCENKNE